MLKIIVGEQELFDEETSTFTIGEGGVELILEHSLVSVSKWESRFKKPFLAATEKTPEETMAYIEAMIVSPADYPEGIVSMLGAADVAKINAYIESTESATTFPNQPASKGRVETITSELVYYWMVTFNIPFECEKWHLNRLLTLIRICVVKNSKPKKMGRNEMAQQQRQLNMQRRAQLNSSG